MDEDANSTRNTMLAQYISLQNICKGVAENTCARIFLWQLNFLLQIDVFNYGKLVFKCEILKKITLMSIPQFTQCEI